MGAPVTIRSNNSNAHATASYADATNGVSVDLAISGPRADRQGTDTLVGVQNLDRIAVRRRPFWEQRRQQHQRRRRQRRDQGRAGFNLLSGGGGDDTVSYADAAGVTVSLAIVLALRRPGVRASTRSTFSNVIGSSFSDTLTGNRTRTASSAVPATTPSSAPVTTHSKAAPANDSLVRTPRTIRMFEWRQRRSQRGRSQNTGDGFDTLSGITNVTGVSVDDVLRGNAGNNTLSGGNGNDTLSAGQVTTHSTAAAAPTRPTIRRPRRRRRSTSEAEVRIPTATAASTR